MFNAIAMQPFAKTAFLATAIVILTATPFPSFAHGNKEGLDIKIRAQNRSDADTPALCPDTGAPGLVGDRLDADVSTGHDGTATGTAVFQGSDGTEVVMNIDKVFVYFGGLALMDTSTRNTVAIWLGDEEEVGPNYNPVHISVEVSRGCENTISTFTVDVDKVTTQINFQ